MRVGAVAQTPAFASPQAQRVLPTCCGMHGHGPGVLPVAAQWSQHARLSTANHQPSTAGPLSPPMCSDASLAMVGHNIQALLAAEQQQVEAQQAQHAQQQRAVAEATAALDDAAAAVHGAQAVVHAAAASWAADDSEGGPGSSAVDNGTAPITAAGTASGPVAAVAAAEPSAAPAAPEPSPGAAARAANGEQLFHFGSGSEGPSALELARQQLVSRLPEEAAAGLEAALHSMHGAPGSRRQRAALASLALHGPAVPAEQLYGVGSHERHPLAAHLDSPGQGTAAEEAGEADRLASEVELRLSLGIDSGSSASTSASTKHDGAADPVLRGSFPGGALLACQCVWGS